MRPPHRFPFELIDREVDGKSVLSATAGSWWLRGRSGLSLPWIVEAAAQAAARVLAMPVDGQVSRLALAGVDAARLERLIAPGELCELRVRLVGRWGGVVKVEADVNVDGERLGRLGLLLATATDGGAA